MHDDHDAANTEQPHLLVVDDSRLMRHAISRILGDDYRITEAVDGETAWSALKSEHDIQVVFSDLSMPNLDGFGLLERIRSDTDPAISNIPVVVITGSEDDDEIRARALHYGASDFISKPIGAAQLRTRAKTHLSLKQTSKKLDQTETHLEEHSITDMLTGINNKNYFDTRIDKDLSYARRHHTELSIILLDLDHFSKLFLEYGKPVTNELLKQIASIGRGNTRNEDTIARIGLSKLGFILPSTDRAGALCMSERICEQIAAIEMIAGDTVLNIAASIGIASYALHNTNSTDDILQRAEICLERSRQQTGCAIVSDAVITAEPEATVAPLSTLPDMNTATDMAATEQAMRLQPYLSALLKRLLPLLSLCNDKLELGIDDAITKIKTRIESRH